MKLLGDCKYNFECNKDSFKYCNKCKHYTKYEEEKLQDLFEAK